MTEGVPARRPPAATIDEVLALYDRWGDDRYDEEVAQLAHALQVAALAIRSGADDPLVAAALLHDVGHLLTLDAATRAAPPSPGAASPTPEDRERHDPHEVTGPAYLAALFPPEVTDPIAGHVAAKRHLCAVDPGYHAGLSAGSVARLRRQGGPMSPDEARAFAATRGSDAAVALRRWDDAGKVDGLAVPHLHEFVPLLHALATRPPGSRG